MYNDTMFVPQVETLGDAVYMVAGGVPERTSNHAASVASVGLELIEKVCHMHCPCAINAPLQIRLGNHMPTMCGLSYYEDE